MGAVIYYDQRGTGLSDYVRGDGYTVAQSVADLDRLRSALGLERWFVLGHSYGGALAQLYALTHTARVAGLILVGSAPPLGLAIGTRQYQFISEAERDRIEQIYHLGGVRVVPSHNAHLNQEDLTNRIYNAFLNGDWKRQQFYKPTRAEMAIIARYEWVHDLGYAEEMVADSSRIDLIGRFQRVGMRTLIMEGAHDLVFDADKPTRFAAEHPRAELVVLDQGGHFPFKDDPDAFFAALRRFMLD